MNASSVIRQTNVRYSKNLYLIHKFNENNVVNSYIQ